MSRKIKFIAIDEFSDAFMYATAFFVDKDNNQGYLAWGIDNHHLVKKDTVGQFTGLKDKNGTEIYEGDILNFGNNNPVEVVFDNGSFNVFDEPLGWDFDIDEYPVRTDFRYCEVIGNIYENPELIE